MLGTTHIASIASVIGAVANVIVAWITLRLTRRPNDDLDRRLLELEESTERLRYEQECASQMRDLLRDSELRQARRDRRCFVIAAIALSLMSRLSRLLGRTRQRFWRT